MNSTKKTARLAGVLYVLLAIVAVPGLLYVPRTLIVPGDAAATADNLRASESLFRFGMASELASAVIFIFLVMVLYRLLKGVNQQQAALMVILAVVSVPITFLNVLNEVAALRLIGGADFLSVVDEPQREALAMLFLNLHNQGIVVAAIFWGLWLLPFGVLVFRSGFLPRILGVLLVINGFAYVGDSFISLLQPSYAPVVSPFLLVPEVVGEFAIMFWLLIKGAKDQPLGAPAS